MIKSMTGYGQGRASGAGGMFTVQIQSVNRKYLEITVHLDREFMELEGPVRQRVAQLVHRGRVNVFVAHEVPAEQHSKVVLNKRLAQEYLDAFEELKKHFHLAGQVELGTLLAAKDVVQVVETHPDKRKVSPFLFRAMDQALGFLDRMRIEEGKSLQMHFRRRLQKLTGDLAAIKKQVPHTLKNYKEKWLKRIGQEGQPTDGAARVDKETAVFADKVDISEEIVRFESHLGQFTQTLLSREPKGKTLEFLVQELVREANTMGSKANDLAISRRIISIKSEIEKIREQVQNVE